MLLVRPKIEPGESWPGYLQRIALTNRLSGIGSLALLYGLTPQQLLARTPTEILNAFSRSVPLKVPGVNRSLSRTRAWWSIECRVCAACLASGTYALREWDDPARIICLVHEIQLTSTCFQCNKSLVHMRPKLQYCQCGADLRTSTRRPASLALRRMQTVLLNTQTSNQETAHLLPKPPSQGSQLIKRFKILADILLEKLDKQARRRKYCSIGWISNAQIDILTSVFEEWPGGLELALARCRSPAHTYEWNKLLERLRVGFDCEWRRAIDQVAKNVSRHKRMALSARNRASPQLLGLKQLIKLSGRGYDGVLRWINNGALTGVQVTRDPVTGNKRFDFSQSNASEIVELYRSSTDVREAANLLGMGNETQNLVRGLVDVGWLSSIQLAKSPYVFRIPVVDIFRLIHHLKERALLRPRSHVGDTHSLIGLIRRGRCKTWRAVADGIRQGYISIGSYSAEPVSLADFFVDNCSDLRRLRDR